MRYISTRVPAAEGGFQKADARQFCDILLEGLAPDGGLYMPERYPRLDTHDLERLRDIYAQSGYAELAFALLSLFIDDISANDLRAICRKTYTAEIFGDPLIVPVRALGAGLYIQALSNGPTLAFKDLAMQLLGNLFEFQLGRSARELNILGATSGDTGSAAEYAMRGKKGVRVFMTSPKERMSSFQQAQMFSLQDKNIFNIAVEGVFDDCQDLVKAVSADLEFKQKYAIGTVNSINWARLLAQVVYYFAGYFQLVSSPLEQSPRAKGTLGGIAMGEPVSFTVPSGNFGNVCAGHVARMMGLPISRLVVATNENDVLDEFFKTGVYRVRSAQNTRETSSPSMDISKASNFERFIFDLLARDGARTQALFSQELVKQGFFDLSQDPHFSQAKSVYGFESGSNTHAHRLAVIKDVYETYQQIIDPHTADGVSVAREYLKHCAPSDAQVPMVVLETALPIKFADTIVQALGKEPSRPAQFEGIERLPRRVHTVSADVSQIKAYIQAQCS